MSEKVKARAWLFLLLDSLRADMRLEGKYEQADRLRRYMEQAGLVVQDLTIVRLREFRDGYRHVRNKPNASLVELEMGC